MSIVLDGTSGLTSPAAVLTTTPLAVTSGGTGVTTSTGSGANVLGTSPTITGATITVAATAAPAFSAYRSGSVQSISSSTATKVQYQTEEFDTNSNYDNATNYRFTPTVAGYYQFSWAGQVDTSSIFTFYLYKNGSNFKSGNIASTTAIGNGANNTALVSMNGSTDYIEIYAYANASVGIQIGALATYFQASMIRSA